MKRGKCKFLKIIHNCNLFIHVASSLREHSFEPIRASVVGCYVSLIVYDNRFFSVDGGFTEWTAWSSACSAKCGEGVFKTRSRTCTNPVEKFGGKPCEGALIEQQDCTELKPCVDFQIAGKIGDQTILPKTETHQAERGK